MRQAHICDIIPDANFLNCSQDPVDRAAMTLGPNRFLPDGYYIRWDGLAIMPEKRSYTFSLQSISGSCERWWFEFTKKESQRKSFPRCFGEGHVIQTPWGPWAEY